VRTARPSPPASASTLLAYLLDPRDAFMIPPQGRSEAAVDFAAFVAAGWKVRAHAVVGRTATIPRYAVQPFFLATFDGTTISVLSLSGK
jgi:hypothetical protein